MRVALHAGQLLQRTPGGIARYERALLHALPDEGVEVVAFAAGHRASGIEPRVPWVDLGFPRGGLRYELWHRLRRPLVGLDADVVHAPSPAIPPTGGVPLVVTIHDVAFLRIPELTTPRGRRFHERGLELARRDATLIIAVSTFTRDELLREGFDDYRVVAIPLGVDLPESRDADDIDATVAAAGVDPPYVLTVGTVEPRKDLPTAVRAVERLCARCPDITLVIAGAAGWGDVEGIDAPFVRRLGAQPWRTLDALYRRAVACCLPSRYEGFGLPALEALARGTPLVTTTGSALEEVVGDAAMLFTPGDVDGCAEALARIIEDGELQAQLARAGLIRARDFTWNANAAAHAQAYAHARAHS